MNHLKLGLVPVAVAESCDDPPGEMVVGFAETVTLLTGMHGGGPLPYTVFAASRSHCWSELMLKLTMWAMMAWPGDAQGDGAVQFCPFCGLFGSAVPSE